MPFTPNIITVTAPGGATLPVPADMPAGAHLVRVSWVEQGINMHLAGPGRWWMRNLDTIYIAADLPAGTQATVYWE